MRGPWWAPWTLPAAAFAVVVGLLAWQLWPRSPAERVARAVRAHGSCAQVEVVRQPRGAVGAERTALPVTARAATEVSSVVCEMAGGSADVLTFDSAGQRASAVRVDPEAARVATCPAGRELLVDAELEGTFGDACEALDGHLQQPTAPCPGLPATVGPTLTPAEEARLDRERHGGPCAFGPERR